MDILTGTFINKDGKNYYHAVILTDSSVLYFKNYGCRANVEGYLRIATNLYPKKIIFLNHAPVVRGIIPIKYRQLFPQTDLDKLD